MCVAVSHKTRDPPSVSKAVVACVPVYTKLLHTQRPLWVCGAMILLCNIIDAARYYRRHEWGGEVDVIKCTCYAVKFHSRHKVSRGDNLQNSCMLATWRAQLLYALAAM